ncbi:MAG: hypothetical protein ACRC53_08165 [Plesiomonas sp.]|uniref:hypothetical protein n=1 Tax=Plesiomonas sp. TaxID=2486279 RepID=UPI003F340C86
MNVSPTNQAVSVLPTSVNPSTEQARHDNQARERIVQAEAVIAAPAKRAVDTRLQDQYLLTTEEEKEQDNAEPDTPDPDLLPADANALIEGEWVCKEDCPRYYPPFPNALTAVNKRMALYGKVIACHYWYSVRPSPKADFRTKT